MHLLAVKLTQVWQFDNLTEYRGPIELLVKGNIPVWAAGSLFRNGPGGRTIENTKSTSGKDKDGTVLISHWFDGIAHLHRFDIVPSGGEDQVKVFYSSRYQADAFVTSVQGKGTVGDTITFGQKADPCVGIFGKAVSVFRALDQGREAAKYDNLNVTVMPGLDVPALTNLKKNSEQQQKPVASVGHRGDSTAKPSKTLWITSDTAGIRVIDATTLEPLGGVALQSELNPLLKGPMSCAHTQICPKTGDVFNYNIQPGRTAVYRIFRVSAATGKTDILATFSRSDLPPAYIHSFFLSERFLVLRVPTSHFGKMGLALPWKGNLLEAIEPFDEAKKCKWFFIDRVHGQGIIAEFETPAAFFFHSVNCWDELAPAPSSGSAGSQQDAKFANVFCDVVDFPNTDFMHKFYYDILMNVNGQTKAAYGDDPAKMHKSMSSLVRWKFCVPLPTTPITSGISLTRLKLSKAKQELPKPEQLFAIPSPHSGELPTINPDYHTRPHRYVYSLPQTGRSTFLDALVKTDTGTCEVLKWDNAAGHTPGEAVFVPRPGGVDEDDGVLLSVVLDGHAEKSYLVCLDARTMQEMGRAEMEFAVGFGLHGMHSPQ